MIFETWSQRLEHYAESKGRPVNPEDFRSFYDVGYSPEEAYELGAEE